jgi:hypothetical protein
MEIVAGKMEPLLIVATPVTNAVIDLAYQEDVVYLKKKK